MKSKPTLHNDNGQPDHDRYERSENAWESEQDDKFERRRSHDNQGEAFQNENDSKINADTVHSYLSKK